MGKASRTVLRGCDSPAGHTTTVYTGGSEGCYLSFCYSSHHLFPIQNPEHDPSPEQTASLLSLLLYSWLDKTVSDACRTEHLKVEQLPPLADDNKAEILVKEGFPVETLPYLESFLH